MRKGNKGKAGWRSLSVLLSMPQREAWHGWIDRAFHQISTRGILSQDPFLHFTLSKGAHLYSVQFVYSNYTHILPRTCSPPTSHSQPSPSPSPFTPTAKNQQPSSPQPPPTSHTTPSPPPTAAPSAPSPPPTPTALLAANLFKSPDPSAPREPIRRGCVRRVRQSRRMRVWQRAL